MKIPLPQQSVGWNVDSTHLYRVKGIDSSLDEFYSLLNESTVKPLPKGTVAKRRVVDKVTRGFKKNSDDSFIYEDYPVPTGSMVVVSNICINLPYSRYMKDKEGFGYVDFVQTPIGRGYLYVLPKEYLYRVHQTALVISTKKNLLNLESKGFVLWSGGKFYVHIIPYKPGATYIATRILKTGVGLGTFKKEFAELLNFWIVNKVMVNPADCVLDSGENPALIYCDRQVHEYMEVDLVPLNGATIYEG